MINAADFQRSLRLAVLVPLAGLVLLVASLFWQVNSLMTAASWTDHTYRVILQSRLLRNRVLHMQSEGRGYLLTHDARFLAKYTQDKAEAEKSLSELSQMVADNPPQVARLQQLGSAYAMWAQLREREQRSFQQGSQNIALVTQEEAAEEKLEAQFDTFRNIEENLLTERSEITRQTAQNARVVMASLSLLLCGVLAFFLRRQMVTLAGSYQGAMTSLRGQADELRQNAQEMSHHAGEIKALNADLEQRVVERTAQLEASNKELEAFSYSVSHDLRAPLRSIDGYSQALLEDYADVIDADGRKYLDRLRNNSRQMAGLIDDLLALSRLTRAEMKRAPVDLTALARGVADELKQRDPERQVNVEIADNLHAEGDERLLRVALENLLGNSWKFTSKKPDARIEMGATTSASGANGQTMYYIRDNGAGFDMAYADKLFGAFQRLHGVSEFEGTGIGLATVQRVIRRHGGRIWAEGEVGKGATFYFTLS